MSAPLQTHATARGGKAAVKTVFMFSGQGSQYYQMGKALFDTNEIFRRWMAKLDVIAQDLSGESVIETIYSRVHGKTDVFDRTTSTHPAIFMIEYALAQSLIHTGVTPDIVLGASLGSFAAAAVAGFVDVEDALAAAIRQAMVLETSCEAGSMIAVLADPILFEEDVFSERSELAAINFSSHFVVSLRKADCAQIEATLGKRNVAHQRLPVSIAFHSRWIEAARAPFGSFMQSVGRTVGHLPLVCCEQASLLAELPHDYLWRVVRNPIRFREAMALLETTGPHRYIDLGPAGTLATFLKYGLPATSRSTAHAILTPYGNEQKNFAAWSASAER
jgi:bacillaene synthase trans-acting acyltransferase